MIKHVTLLASSFDLPIVKKVIEILKPNNLQYSQKITPYKNENFLKYEKPSESDNLFLYIIFTNSRNDATSIKRYSNLNSFTIINGNEEISSSSEQDIFINFDNINEELLKNKLLAYLNKLNSETGTNAN